MTKKAKPANYKTDWSKRDVGRLKACAMVGKSSREAAATLGRTPGAVRYKAMVERITLRRKRPRRPSRRMRASAPRRPRKARRRRPRNSGRPILRREPELSDMAAHVGRPCPREAEQREKPLPHLPLRAARRQGDPHGMPKERET
jgi:hypothetical protein